MCSYWGFKGIGDKRAHGKCHILVNIRSYKLKHGPNWSWIKSASNESILKSNYAFPEALHTAWKYGKVPKRPPVAEGPYITTTLYCPTHFFVLRLDRTGTIPYLVAWNAFHQGCLMELILGLIVLKSPLAGTFSGPPLQLAGTLSIFVTKVSGYAVISFSSTCSKFLGCISCLGFKNWLDIWRWRPR